MATQLDLDRVRAEALTRIARSERNFKLVLLGAAVCEAAFLGTFLLAADLHDRTHVLLLLATVGSYTLIAIGLFALGEHVNRGILRVLKAIDVKSGPV